MIYEYDAFIEVPEKLGEDKMAELDCAIACFVEDEFGYPVEFSVVGQINEETGDADIEKVVRCKDCKHYCPVYADTMGGRDCLLLKTITKANDFCSYGKRREDDESN